MRGKSRLAEPIDAEVEVKAARILARLYGGLHHVPYWRLRKPWGPQGVLVSVHTELSSFDFDHLTRLVIAAHDDCVRVAVVPGGRQLSVGFYLREREGDSTRRHPTLDEAIAKFRGQATSIPAPHAAEVRDRAGVPYAPTPSVETGEQR
jgi:hypothetical protein